MSFAGTVSQLAGLQTSKVGLLLGCFSTHLTSPFHFLGCALNRVNGVDSISIVCLLFATDPHCFLFGIVLTYVWLPVGGMAILVRKTWLRGGRFSDAVGR